MKNKKALYGSTMLVVLANIVIMAALIGVAASISSTTKVMSARSAEMIDTTIVADSAIQQLYGYMSVILSKPNMLPSNVTYTALYNSFNTNTAPTNLFSANQYRFLNYTVIPLTINGVPANLPDSATVDGKQYRFLAVSWVQSLQNPAVISKVQQEMQFTFRPLFEYAIFYNPNMEMHNGPAMVLSGKVHSNGTIHTFANGALTFNSQVTSVNGISLTGPTGGYAQGQTGTGTRTYNSGPPSLTTRKELPGMLDSTNTYGNPNLSTNGAIQLIKRPVLGNYNGTNYTMYGSGSNAIATTDPYAPIQGVAVDHPDQVNTRMYYKADLRILVDNTRVPKFYTGTITDAKPNGDEIPLLVTNTIVMTNGTTNLVIVTNQTYLTLANSIQTTSRISDFRWNYDYVNNRNRATDAITNVQTIKMNINNLLDTNGNLHQNISSYNTSTITTSGVTTTITNTTPIPDFKGIIYLSNTDASSSNKQGVVLNNGNKLPNCVIANGVTNQTGLGLSIVTDNPLYIVGDYNTGGVSNAVPSNAATGANANDSTYNLTNSTSTGYTRLPASVMADAVSLVSKQYLEGAQTMLQSSVDNRATTYPMTINTAILTGAKSSTINTNGTQYQNQWASGGAHNFPRFLEKWGHKVVINGSLVNLFESEQAKDPGYASMTDYAMGVPVNLRGNTFDTYYGAPTRVWNFDVNFLDPMKLPPGTPMIREFTLGQWAKVQ